MVRSTEARLTRDTVADGAIALADSEGLEALTIRRLAQELAVTPMALYWHFKNKDELLDGVADRLWDEVDRSPHPTRPLLEQLRTLLESLVTVLRRHRAVVPLLQSRKAAEPGRGFLEATEMALGILDELGFDDVTAAWICMNALRTAVSLVVGEPGASSPQQSAEDHAEALRRNRLMLQSLPEHRYPHVVRTAQPLTSCDDPDRHYARGLDFFMAGVAAFAAAK